MFKSRDAEGEEARGVLFITGPTGRIFRGAVRIFTDGRVSTPGN